MAIRINWSPTTEPLDQIHRAMTGQDDWPRPQVDALGITAEERNRARATWIRRTRGIYVTAGYAASLSRQLMALGAPINLISGAAYTAAELARHVSATLHLLRPLEPEMPVEVPDACFDLQRPTNTWKDVFDKSVEFYLFNLGISQPTYEAIAAISSDPAISELTDAMASSLTELTDFGRLSLLWMSKALQPTHGKLARRNLPSLFSKYEELCGGSQRILDELAGKEMIIETAGANLGTLKSKHLSAIFYHTLSSSIFPVLDQLGWRGEQAWQQHYSKTKSSAPISAVIAAIGVGEAI